MWEGERRGLVGYAVVGCSGSGRDSRGRGSGGRGEEVGEDVGVYAQFVVVVVQKQGYEVEDGP